MGLNLRKRFTEFVLIFLILLNIWDFLGPALGFARLPGDIDFLKKILSWTIMAHLFYEVSFTWLFFGKKHDDKSGILSNRFLDLSLLMCFLLFAIKNLVGVSQISVEEAIYFKELVQFLAINGATIETISFYVAGTGLLLISLYMTFFTKVDKRSLLGNLGFYDRNWLIEFFGVFLIFTSFYIIVFDLIIEWLAIAVDSTLIVLGIFVYVFLIARMHKKFGAESLIFRIGNFGENFEEHFLKYFHDKKHVFLGMSGLLVLHLLTEISNFLIPYLFNMTNSFYFATLGHSSLHEIFLAEIAMDKLLIFGYLLNIIAILGLVLFPAILWYEIYKSKHNLIPRWVISVFLGSLVYFILNPLFKFEALHHDTGLIGANILTKSLIVQDSNLILMICGGVILILFLLSFVKFIAKLIYHVSVLTVVGFFGYYLYLFYLSTGRYFIENISMLFNQQEWFFVFFFSIFFFAKALFVLVAFVAYFVQLNKKHLV